MAGWMHKFFCCPFYVNDDDRYTVHCEGGSRVRLADRNAASRFYDAYCANNINWRLCCIASARLDLYDGKEKA